MTPETAVFVEPRGLAAEQARSEGVAQGRVEGVSTAITSILHKRSVHLNYEQFKAIHECRDLKLLFKWLRRSIEVAFADELFV